MRIQLTSQGQKQISTPQFITDFPCGKFSGPLTFFLEEILIDPESSELIFKCDSRNIKSTFFHFLIFFRGFSGPFLIRKQKRKLEEIRIIFRHVHSSRVEKKINSK